jgi:transglutaminase-like putative cysteine protease
MARWTRGGAAAVLLAGAAAALAGSERPAGALLMEPDAALLKAGESRTFTVTYDARIRNVPLDSKRLRIWLPVPQDTPVQTIRGLTFMGTCQPKAITFEKRFGNKLAYWEIDKPRETFPPEALVTAGSTKVFDWDFSYSFTCTRREQVTDLDRLKEDGKEGDASAAEFLKDDKLTMVDDRIRKMAQGITDGRKTTLEKARAIYDYVFDHMAYDKSGKGWGRGDTNFACDVGKGNCTDFHALFMSLCRASGIPAGFEIGLYAPYKKGSDEKLGGYHCWSFFRVPGKAWVPVDISEAWKNKDRKDYFFGAHTSNRVTLSVGRDLVLEPKQDGAPLNYLLNPYAEADGKSLETSKDWTCKDSD